MALEKSIPFCERQAGIFGTLVASWLYGKTSKGISSHANCFGEDYPRTSYRQQVASQLWKTSLRRQSIAWWKRRESNWENRNLKLTTTTKRKRCHQRVPRQWSGSFSSFTYNLCRRDQIAESYRFFTPFVQADVLLRSAKERRRTRRNSDGKHEL